KSLPYNQLEIRDCIKFLKTTSIPKAEIEADMAQQNVRAAGKTFEEAKTAVERCNAMTASKQARVDALVQMREMCLKNNTGTGPSQNEVDMAAKEFAAAQLDCKTAEGEMNRK